MKQIIKQIIEQTPLYYPLRNWLSKRRQLKKIERYESLGRPVPPPHIIKQRVLQAYANRYGLKVLVETGTYYGDMVEAMKTIFDHIYSIELNKYLHEKAKKRFKGAKHVDLIHGDSGKELLNVMKKIDQPALFWLDGHYSGSETDRGEKDTPIWEELYHIFSGQDSGHVIIDDARLFGTDPAYPTIRELKDFIFSRRDNVEILVQDDSIRITSKS